MGESLPREVEVASYLILLDIFCGIIVSAIMYSINEDWTAGLGLIVSIVGFWVYLEIKKLNPQAWQMGIFLNLIGIALYLLGDVFIGLSGALVCLIVIFYLYQPNVRQHFQ